MGVRYGQNADQDADMKKVSWENKQQLLTYGHFTVILLVVYLIAESLFHLLPEVRICRQTASEIFRNDTMPADFFDLSFHATDPLAGRIDYPIETLTQCLGLYQDRSFPAILLFDEVVVCPAMLHSLLQTLGKLQPPNFITRETLLTPIPRINNFRRGK